ncbi:MAG: polysaccharide deacetylase family protein [Anaerolineales bacterium]|nr:MAG: polysaccharide deacetylase family protein [Anaerolineales bacterium]
MPSKTNTGIPVQISTAVPALQWEALKNAAYPNEWAVNGVVQLINGIYTQKTLPEPAIEVYFQLSHLRAFADLNDDDIDDALVVLMVDTGGSGTRYYLNGVLDQNGRSVPAASLYLGEQIFIRSMTVQEGFIQLVYDSLGEEDYSCCPKDSKQYTYRLEGDQFDLLEVVDLPDPQVGGRPDIPPQRIVFEPESHSTMLASEIGFNQIDWYLLYADAGQRMRVEIQSPQGDVLFSVFGEDGGEVLTSILSEAQSWEGVLPTAQDYLISVVAAGADTDYGLYVALAGSDSAALPPGFPLQDESEKVVYLTFDDGPTARWTPQILAVLARYNAHAAFFVLGEQVEQYPEVIASILEAGHTLGNHSFDHQSFDGITRQGFNREVRDTEKALGGTGTQCLRPPYGAVDAYTRIYAAENGYRTVMWDVDPQDWRRPGVTAIMTRVLTEVQPGDVVLFHDGGGDRSQTVRALDLILKELSSQGYAFALVCN